MVLPTRHIARSVKICVPHIRRKIDALRIMASFKRSAALNLLLIVFLVNQLSIAAQDTAQKTETDEEFLEDLEKRAFQYFWDHSGEKTGLTLDRAQTTGQAAANGTANHNVASIAATGFALTSYCIAAERNWISTAEAKNRTQITLKFFADRAFHIAGWFFHWLDSETGERRWQSEISSIDTRWSSDRTTMLQRPL
jgi:hypothetical protein